MFTYIKKVCFFVLFASFSFAHDECVEPDHMLGYAVDFTDNFQSQTVLLEDQFLGGQYAYNVSSPFSILAPAKKWHDGNWYYPKNPKNFYTLHYVEPDISFTPLQKYIRISNQFGIFRYDIQSQGEFLMVPSIKKDCDDCGFNNWPLEDHYLCHIVDADYNFGEGIKTYAVFKDDFQNNRIIEDIRPFTICNPVTKVHNGITYERHDEENNHLMCFLTWPKNLRPNKWVSLLNQFGEHSGLAILDWLTCVPSVKIDENVGK